ncbi:MAG: hypothetical protein L3J07_02845 [Candidatus Magasanikbacteria bacterium]|nr:hypothetical protein [Candidatus Magasanikbacteria bacterium]
MDNTSQNWAVELQKQKTKLQNSGADIQVEKENNDYELNKVKIDLIKSAEEKDFNKIAENYNKLVELFAKETALNLLNLEKRFGTVNEIVIKNQAKLFTQECLDVAQAVDSILDSS